MRTSTVLAVLAAVVGGVACNSTTGLQTNFEAALTGLYEVPAVPSSTGAGSATITVNGLTINYTLTITAATASNYTASHIHTGAAGISGPAQVFLCGGGTAPACPTGQGTVTSSFTATSGSQVLLGGAVTYDSLVTAVRNRATYVNLHTVNYSGGEIRGQLIAAEQPKQ